MDGGVRTVFSEVGGAGVALANGWTGEVDAGDEFVGVGEGTAGNHSSIIIDGNCGIQRDFFEWEGGLGSGLSRCVGS